MFLPLLIMSENAHFWLIKARSNEFVDPAFQNYFKTDACAHWSWPYRRLWRRVRETRLQMFSCSRPPAVYPPVRDAEETSLSSHPNAPSTHSSAYKPELTERLELYQSIIIIITTCKCPLMSHITCKKCCMTKYTHIHLTVV